MKKDLVMGIYVDFMGTLNMGMKKEMDYIQTVFKDEFPDIEFLFKREMHPHNLKQSPIDLYVFDWGGVMPGCDRLTETLYNTLVAQIGERPNTLFVIWSSFSERYYKDELENAFPKEKDKKFHNVLFKGGGGVDDSTKFWEAVKLWISEIK